MKLSGIGGQAVMEGVMMRNKDKYSVAVRKPDNEIIVVTKMCKSPEKRSAISRLPIIRGIVNFVDALVIGISTLTYSSSFYEDPKEQEPTKVDNVAKAVFREKLDSVIMAVTILCSVILAIALFMVAPYYVSRLLSRFIVSQWVLNLIEGLVRVLIFIIYILLISMMSDIKRTFMYHGAEHKCINCIEHGMALTVENVRSSSREHKRCGTSFIFMVMFISVIFFIFIRLQNPILQVVVRILLVPVIAGISYEIIQWAGRSESKAVMLVSKPGMWLQRLTTREPDDSMIQVGIKAVEAVFDWKTFLDEYYADVADEDIPEEAYYYEDEYTDEYSEYEDEEYSDEDYEEDEEADETASDEESSEYEEPDDGTEYEEEPLTDDEGEEVSSEYEADTEEYTGEEHEDSASDGESSEDEENNTSTEETPAEEDYTEESAEDDVSDENTEDDSGEDYSDEDDPEDDDSEFEIEYDTDKDEDEDGEEYEEAGEASDEDVYDDEDEMSDDEEHGDGIEFIDEESVEDEDVGIDVPIFKQRGTEIKKNDKKR